MKSAVISDLHLGTLAGNDLLSLAPMRERLFEATREVDQLVLLGDMLELREAPVGATLVKAYDFLDHVNEAFAGRRVVIAAGNHDHPLVAQWLDGRRLKPDPTPLPVESCVKAPRSAGLLGNLAKRLKDCDTYLAYPGLRLRDDVYATHGHYLDLHMTIPTLETIALSVACRLEGHDPDDFTGPDDYQAVVEPLYSLVYSAIQGRRHRTRPVASGASAIMWGRLHPAETDLASRARAIALRQSLAGAVAVLNASGLGPFGSDLTGKELRRAGVAAMCRVVERLGIEADWVVFGHTHRAGPLPREGDWRAPNGTRLVNTGAWTWAPALVRETGPAGPYWPGRTVIVDEEGPPRHVEVLADVPPSEMPQPG